MNSVMHVILLLVEPLCVVWLLLTLWVVMTLWRRHWYRSALPALAWAVLSLIACTSVPSWLMMKLEDDFPVPEMAAMQGADAIVCLGGGVEASLKEPTGFHLTGAGDRLATALSLAVSRTAPVLVVGGGAYEHEGRWVSEADAIRDHLAKSGTLAFELISLGICANTRDEAVKVAALMKERGWKKVLLVTSASHMKRAVATFQKADAPVLAVPCHYVSSYHRLGEVDWVHLPYAGSFDMFDAWLHEILGQLVYRQRGWVD